MVLGLKIQASSGDDAVRKLHAPGGYLATLALVVKNATPVSSLLYSISFAPQYTQGNFSSAQLGGFVDGDPLLQYDGFVKFFGVRTVNLNPPFIGES